MLRKDTVIINLGAVVRSNIQLAIDAYRDLIVKKIGIDNHSLTAVRIRVRLLELLVSKMEIINQFKDGRLEEGEFNKQMIYALKDATGVELTIEEFDDCWHKQHPAYEDFAESLNQAIAYGKASGKKIIFTSYTNPKDMRNLMGELFKHKVPFNATHSQLSEIDGIELHLSYVEHKSTDVLFADLIKRLKTGGIQSSSIRSMLSFLSSDESRMPPYIVYISTPNDILELTLKTDLDKNMSCIEEMVRHYGIDCICWDKSKQSLEKVFEGLQISYKAAVSQ